MDLVPLMEDIEVGGIIIRTRQAGPAGGYLTKTFAVRIDVRVCVTTARKGTKMARVPAKDYTHGNGRW